MKSLYSASLEVITSGLPVGTLPSMHGSGIAPIRAGTLATRPVATLCSLQGLSEESVMEDFDVVNDRVKDSINAFLKDSSDNPVNTISDFGLKFFKSICKNCVRRDCVVRNMMYDADKIVDCKYFMPAITKALESTLVPDTNAVGGTIFYIDDTADGEYQFFDVDGSLIESVQVGDRPYAYKVVSPGSKDKYYVYYDKLYEGLWTYYKSDDYVRESLGTSNRVGSGKTNTEVVMAKDNGAYIAMDFAGHSTIWHQLQLARLAKVGGCDDWFIPSKYEIEKLRLAIESGNIAGGVIAGSSYEESIFTYKWLWSSSELSSRGTWSWYFGGQGWYTSYKAISNSVFFTRAF